MGFVEGRLKKAGEVFFNAGMPLSRGAFSLASLVFAANNDVIPFVLTQIVCPITDLEGRMACRLGIPIYQHEQRDRLADLSWNVSRNVGICLILGNLFNQQGLGALAGISILAATLTNGLWLKDVKPLPRILF